MGAILKSSPGLISLNVSWCRKISDRTIDYVRENNKSIRKLNVQAIENISEEALSRLQESNKLVEIMSGDPDMKHTSRNQANEGDTTSFDGSEGSGSPPASSRAGEDD